MNKKNLFPGKEFVAILPKLKVALIRCVATVLVDYEEMISLFH